MATHAKDDPRLVRFRDGFWFSGALLRREAAELEALRARLRPDGRDDLLHAVATVWQIVDTVHRVRELAQATPGMSQREPFVRAFLVATTVAESSRHYVQHLRQELAEPNHNFPVWGSLSWVSIADPAMTFTAVTGAVPAGTEIGGAVYDRLEQRWVSRVSLSIRGAVFNVDPIVEATMAMCEFALARIAAMQPDVPPLDNFLSFSAAVATSKLDA
jgi:hypothetical protein